MKITCKYFFDYYGHSWPVAYDGATAIVTDTDACPWAENTRAKGSAMICLRCGECCRTMSPLEEETDDEKISPCSHLTIEDGVARCAIYTCRPQQCTDHDYPASVCPIGLDLLRLSLDDIDAIRARGRHVRHIDSHGMDLLFHLEVSA